MDYQEQLGLITRKEHNDGEIITPFVIQQRIENAKASNPNKYTSQDIAQFNSYSKNFMEILTKPNKNEFEQRFVKDILGIDPNPNAHNKTNMFKINGLPEPKELINQLTQRKEQAEESLKSSDTLERLRLDNSTKSQEYRLRQEANANTRIALARVNQDPSKIDTMLNQEWFLKLPKANREMIINAAHEKLTNDQGMAKLKASINSYRDRQQKESLDSSDKLESQRLTNTITSNYIKYRKDALKRVAEDPNAINKIMNEKEFHSYPDSYQQRLYDELIDAAVNSTNHQQDAVSADQSSTSAQDKAKGIAAKVASAFKPSTNHQQDAVSADQSSTSAQDKAKGIAAKVASAFKPSTNHQPDAISADQSPVQTFGDSVEENINQDRSRLDSSKHMQDELNSQISNLQTQAATIRNILSKSDKLSTEQISKYETMLNNATTRLSVLQSQGNAAQNDINMLNGELTQIQDEIKSLNDVNPGLWDMIANNKGKIAAGTIAAILLGYGCYKLFQKYKEWKKQKSEKVQYTN